MNCAYAYSVSWLSAIEPGDQADKFLSARAQFDSRHEYLGVLTDVQDVPWYRHADGPARTRPTITWPVQRHVMCHAAVQCAVHVP